MRLAHRPRVALTLLLVVGSLLSLPHAVAAEDDDEIETCFSDNSCKDPIEAMKDGFGGLIQAIFELFIKPILAVGAGIGGLILGFLRVPLGLFQGLADGFKDVGEAAFSGIGDFFDAAFAEATAFFANIKIGGVPVLGPFAPFAATATAIMMVVAFLWLVGLVFRRSDDLLPESVEKMFRDEDDE